MNTLCQSSHTLQQKLTIQKTAFEPYNNGLPELSPSPDPSTMIGLMEAHLYSVPNRSLKTGVSLFEGSNEATDEPVQAESKLHGRYVDATAIVTLDHFAHD